MAFTVPDTPLKMSADRPRGACPTRLPTSTWSPFFTTGSHSAPICCCMGSTISLGTGISMVSSSAVSLRWGTTAPRVRRNRDNRAVAFMGVHSPRRALAGAVGRCADRTEPHLAVCGQGEALNSLRYEMLVILREPHVRFQESSVKGNHVARQRRVRRFSRAQFAGGRCRSRWRGMRPGIDAFHAAPVARPSLAALSKNREHKFLNSRSKHAAV